MSVTYGGSTYYYATNVQGDIVAILNSSGTAVVQYTYDAWGNVLTTTGSMASTLGVMNPLRYRGYVYDTETGLYYLQSRYYDPEIGRFGTSSYGGIGGNGWRGIWVQIFHNRIKSATLNLGVALYFMAFPWLPQLRILLSDPEKNIAEI